MLTAGIPGGGVCPVRTNTIFLANGNVMKKDVSFFEWLEERAVPLVRRDMCAMEPLIYRETKTAPLKYETRKGALREAVSAC